MTGDVRVPPSKGSRLFLGSGLGTITMEGSSTSDANAICGNNIVI